MKKVELDQLTKTSTNISTEFEIQKEIYFTLRKTEIRIAEGVQHLKVIKIILLIYLCFTFHANRMDSHYCEIEKTPLNRFFNLS